MQNYIELTTQENLYEEAKGKIKNYNKAEFGTAVLLLLLLIIPGALYITFKCVQKSIIKKHNGECESIMKKAVADAKSI